MQASPQRVDNSGSFASRDAVYGQSGSGQPEGPSAAPHSARGIHGVKSRAAQQKLQQQQQQQQVPGPLSTNRMRTLTMSTPHLIQHPKHAHFNFANHLAVRDHTVAHRAGPQPGMVAVTPIALVVADPTILQSCYAGTSLASLPWHVGQQQLQLQHQQSVEHQLQSRESWWGSGSADASGQPNSQRQRIASVQLVRSCSRGSETNGNGAAGGADPADRGRHKHRLNTTDSVFGAITPPPL